MRRTMIAIAAATALGMAAMTTGAMAGQAAAVTAGAAVTAVGAVVGGHFAGGGGHYGGGSVRPLARFGRGSCRYRQRPLWIRWRYLRLRRPRLRHLPIAAFL